MNQNYSTETLDRIAKLDRIRALGIEPYGRKYDVTTTIGEIIKSHPKKLSEWTSSPFRDVETVIANPNATVSIAGRIFLHRSFGKICFATIGDWTEKIQILFSKENCKIFDGEAYVSELTSSSETVSAYKFAEKILDIGDFIGVTGELFYTHKWGLALFVEHFTFLSKALRPLPEKFHGINDKETLYRERNLDLVTNEDSFDRFKLRSKVVREIRNFFHAKNFDEVETAILQPQAGGAMAKTFSSYHNDLDHEFVLRISLELDLKRAIAWGFQRVFEIGKNFRNEWTDPSHLQEFTMCEWYASYLDLDTNKTWTEELFHHIAKTCLPSPVVQVMNKQEELVDVDLSKPFDEKRFPDLLREYAGLDMFTADMDELKAVAKKYGVEKIEWVGRANLLDDIYKKTARPKLVQPTFVFDYPEDLKPLARPNGDWTAACFQLVINGWEVVNSYGELINPLTQRKLFEVQSAAKAGGDEEAMEIDEVFLKAMEHGFPPMTGSGFGIDRLVTLFTGQPNLRDVVLFPTMKPILDDSNKNNVTKEK